MSLQRKKAMASSRVQASGMQRLAACALAVSLAFAPLARADVIEDLASLRQGDSAVVRVRFNAPVRVVQQAPLGESDVFRIRLEFLGAADALTAQQTAEFRQVPGTAGMPEFSLSFAPGAGQRFRELTLQLRSRSVITVRQGSGSREIDIVFRAQSAGAPAVAPSATPAVPPASTTGRLSRDADEPALPAPSPSGRWFIQLARMPLAEADKMPLLPRRLQPYEAFTAASSPGGVPTIALNIGYFANRADAETARAAAIGQFAQAVILERDVVSAQAAAAGETQAAASAPAEGVAAAAPPDEAALREMEIKAADLMGQSRQAMDTRKFDDAVALLNQLLLLPPNAQSEAAQAMIGDAWVGAGNERRARLEYELYLKLYPKGAAAPKVRTQLAAIGGAAPVAAAGAPGAAASAGADGKGAFSYAGTIAEYFNGGRARSQSLVNLPSGINQSTLSTTSESALVTSADLSARYASKESEVRAVLRGSGSTNLSSTSRSTSLLSAAYVDYRNLSNSLAVRLGRQSAISGGLFGMFDGVSLAYPVRSGIKVDLMAGVPANTLVSSPQQRLLGAMVELDGLLDKWGGNVYIVNQTSEGYTNRRGVGGEVRYSDEKWSGFALVDYDINLRALNAVTLQGSWQAPAQTSVTLLLDDRKAPSLALNNALISNGAATLADLFAQPGFTLEKVRADALATSARAQQALVSVSRPINERWQISSDLRFSRVGALPQVGDIFEATPATGAQYTGSMQLTGSNLYSRRDINSFNVSVLTTPLFKGAQLSYSNLTGLLNNDLTLEPSLRYYRQTDSTGLKAQRVSTGLRVSYRATRRISVLAEGVLERASTDGPTSTGTTNAGSFYMGLRYELF
jgi:hypothetical protein